MEKKLTIKERILLIADYKGLSKQSFFKSIGVTYANFKGQAKKTSINSDILERIFAIMPELNLEWLLTGKGNMIKDSDYLNRLEEPRADYNKIEHCKELEDHINTLKKLVESKEQEIKHIKEKCKC